MRRVLTVLAVVAALAVLFGAAVVATRGGEVLRDAPRDAADLGLPSGALTAQDLSAVRLGMAVRGYRMSEVDDLLDRVVSALEVRDARLAELEDARDSARPAGAHPAAVDLQDRGVPAPYGSYEPGVPAAEPSMDGAPFALDLSDPDGGSHPGR